MSHNSDHYFLRGGGEMGELIRAKDWSETPLGDPENWPQSLCTMVAVMLENPFGMYIAWGNDYTQIYNDAYRPILGENKHPQALGSSSRETFSEIWHTIEAMFADVMRGKPIGFSDFMFPLNRNGFVEECFFDFAYSPIRKDDGEVGGVLVTVIETTNKKKAEQKLEESNKHFRNTMKQAPIGITILRGYEYIVEMANDAYLLLVDKKETDFVGKPLFVSLPEVEESVHALLDNVLNTGVPFHGNEVPIPVNRYGRLDLCYFDFLYYPLREDDGKISGIIVSVTEVTEKVKVRKTVEERELLYEAITQNTPDLIYVFDLNYRFTFANEALVKMLGRTSNTIIGKNMLEVGYEPWQAEMHEREIDKVIATKKPVRGEVSFFNANLGKRIHDYIFAPVLNDIGEVKAVTGTTRDISDIKAAEEELKKSEEQFSTLADNMENLAWIADGEGWIYWYNKRWFEYTGCTLEEMQGWGWEKVHHPDHIDHILKTVKDLWQKNETFELTFPLRRHDGVYRWFLTRAFPVVNGEGKIIRWIGTNTDITEQKKAEDQFKVLADQSPMWVWLSDKEKNILYSNVEMLRFIGIAHYKDFTGLIWEQKVHPEDIAIVYEHFEIAVALQQPFSFEIRVTNAATQQYEWFYIKGVPRFEQGEFTGYIGTGININEQKNILSQLEYRKALLEAHNESSLDGILLVDKKGKMLSYNHRFVEIWNMPQQIIDDKDDEAALAFALTQLENPEQFIVKVKWLYEHPDEISIDELEFKDGKIIERHGYPVAAANGSQFAWSWMFRDITKQRKSERLVKESEERFRSLAQTLPQLIWVTDAQGNLEFASFRWKDYSGIEPGGEKEWKELVHPDDYDNINAAWTNCLLTGHTYKFDVRFKRKDGVYRWHSIIGEPVYDNDNKILKWVGACTDIQTEKVFTQELEKLVKERTQALENTNIELAKMNKELQSFAYISSHDLQEPLRKIQTIVSYITAKEVNNLSEKGKDFFKRMQQAAQRMQALIEDLLAYSSIKATEIKLENTDLNKIIEEVKDDLKEELMEKHATIETNKLCNANIIPFQFRQLLHNLIGNSLKFSKSNVLSHIQIKSDIKKGIEFNIDKLLPQVMYCHISYADNGIGFEQQYSEKIFELFQSLHDRTEYNGTGIGLSIVKKIVENHNGIIIAKGELNKGATFDIYFPTL